MNKRTHLSLFYPLFFLWLLPCLLVGQEYELVEEAQFRELPNLEVRRGTQSIQVDRDGFLWFTGPLGIQRYDGTVSKVFEYNPNRLNGLSGNWVCTMEQDASGQFWIGIFGVGLQKFDPVTEQFSVINPILLDTTQTFIPYIVDITVYRDKSVWVETQNGLWRYTPEKNTIKYFPKINIAISPNGDLWGVSGTGIYIYNSTTEHFDLFYKIKDGLTQAESGTLNIPSTGDLFFTFHNNNNILYRFSPQTKEWKEYQITPNGITKSIIEISHKQLLITIENSDKEYRLHELYQFDLEKNKLKKVYLNKEVVEKMQYSGAKIEVGQNIISNGGYIGVVDINRNGHLSFQVKDVDGNHFSFPHATLIESPQSQLFLSSRLVIDIENSVLKDLTYFYPELRNIQTKNTLFNNDKWFQDALGNYWICKTSGIGLKSTIHYFECETGQLTKKGSITDVKSTLFANIVQDNEGSIWLGYWGGLMKFNPYTNTQEPVMLKANRRAISGTRILYKDSSGDIWIGTQNGLYHYNSQTENIQHYVNIPNDTTSLSYNMISCIREGENGVIWVGSYYGLNAFNKKDNKFTSYYFNGGSQGNLIQSIEVVDSIIWFANELGINKFNPARNILNTFDTTNGLLNAKFHANKSLKLSNGNLLFAGNKGIDVIDPKTLQKNQHIPPIKITGFSLFNQEVEIMGADSILTKSITYTKSIALNHDQDVFSFSFAALDYMAPDKNEYAYQMVGFDEDWQYIGNKHEATFTNLDPGTYTFKVKGSNNDGIWNEEGTSLTIIIHPPWYWSWWTKTLYGLLSFGLLYTFYRFQLRRRLAERESLRLKELDDAKNQLYTNITHDFRTPLTIIQGMTEQIKSKQYTQEKRLIQRNTQKLLQMVNQILDLSKLEAGKLSLHLQQSDIVAFLKNEMTAYIALATSQNIDLQFQCETEELEMDFDPFLLRQILANLLSNALKFIAKDGKIMVRVQKTEAGRSPQLLIAVEDTGKGIPEDQLDKIFDRYYQVPDSAVYSTVGTGIGLAHTKKLVGLMGGEVSVESVVDIGSTFSLILPITQEAAKASIEEISLAYIENTTVSSLKSIDKRTTVVENFDLPLVLIVEDNEDVIQYLIRCLQEDYRILTALNGAEGVKTALKHIPDLIISDVMMPEVDGFSLTAQLKNDERSSHIPIVLLTAKADQEAKIAGLQSGADAYVYKPFDRKEMLVRLEKLLELRKKLQQHYASPDQLELLSKKSLSIDEQFLKNVQTIIKQHLDDADYNVEQLAADVHLSRAQLFRKIKALTGESVSAYMRLIRLTQAKRMLQSDQFTVAEVAYQVGFNDPAYFSRCFSDLFGFPPSEV